MTNNLRGQQIIVQEPIAPDAPVGTCRWCGQEIIVAEGVHHSVHKRRYHRGDDKELNSTVDCKQQYETSFIWSARDALKYVAKRDHQGRLFCVDCGTLCQVIGEHKQEILEDYCPWDADHQVPLWDRGEHTVDNLRVRCQQCHKNKTISEATQRAQKRVS